MELWAQSMQWLSRSVSGSTEHTIAPSVYWHARAMVLAWGVLLPTGALVARYFKVTPRQRWPAELDNPLWWHGHRTLQYTGVLVMSLGLWLVWRPSEAAPFSATGMHRLLGWLVLVLGWLQVLGGIVRGSKGGPTDVQLRGDHFDMTPWRIAFERLHKSMGWLAVLVSVVVVLLGMVSADAPRWMVCALAAWWALLVGVAVYLQRRGSCIDTYQAIWGTSPELPGMQRPPIGWGVRRTQQNPWHPPSTQP
ncbi:MAG: cytochrome B [Rhodoferax sp.]|nr:cytochrome B [Rhodoferax sp.]